jgi:hypothetical protein
VTTSPDLIHTDILPCLIFSRYQRAVNPLAITGNQVAFSVRSGRDRDRVPSSLEPLTRDLGDGGGKGSKDQ